LDGEYTIDCGGVEYPVELSEKPFFDPTNSRLKS
jgi:glycine cleavage system aminomethyltransferase T